MKKTALACLAAVLSSSASAEAPVFSSSLAWDSLYVAQGRKSLEEGGLAHAALAAEWDRISAEIWWGEGTSQAYSELNAGIAYSLPLGSWDLGAGYTYLNWTRDDTDDHEFSISASRPLFGPLALFAEAVYATEASGLWIDVGLEAGFEASGGALSITPSLLLGTNAGYIADEDDGPNHIQAGLDASWSLTENLALTGGVYGSMPLPQTENDSLSGTVWFSLGVAVVY